VQAYVITNGGPEDSSLFYVLYLYRVAFQNFDMGYASAMAWLLFVIILIITLVPVPLRQPLGLLRSGDETVRV